MQVLQETRLQLQSIRGNRGRENKDPEEFLRLFLGYLLINLNLNTNLPI
jgi:hypothetical protein